jgi:hypothetical protein
MEKMEVDKKEQSEEEEKEKIGEEWNRMEMIGEERVNSGVKED